MPTIQFNRGNLAGSIPTLADGEPGWIKDFPRLLIGSAGGNRLMAVLHKINATTAPTVNDDAADGFSEGSTWTDTTNDKAYTCVDSTTGAAVWVQHAGTGTGTVTSFSSTSIAGLFSTNVLTATTTPALQFALNTHSAHEVYAGPTSGGAASPTFRALVASDMPAGFGVAGSDTEVQVNVTGSMGVMTGFTAGSDTVTVPKFVTTKDVVASGTINPSSTGSNQNNYNPTGLATTFAINIVPTANIDITGLTAQPDGSFRLLRNIGGFTITLKASSGSSSAANRFLFPNDYTLKASGAVLLHYYGSSGWKLVGAEEAIKPVSLGGTGANLGATGGTAQYVQQSSAGAAFTVSTIFPADYPAFVAAGGSNARGAVPAPGSTAHTNNPKILGDMAAFVAHSGKVLGISTVATDETRTSATIGDLATADEVLVNADVAGDILVWWFCNVYHSASGGNCRDIVTVGGVDVSASQIDWTAPAANTGVAACFCYPVNLASGFTNLSVKVRHANALGTGTAHWRNRTLVVTMRQ